MIEFREMRFFSASVRGGLLFLGSLLVLLLAASLASAQTAGDEPVPGARTYGSQERPEAPRESHAANGTRAAAENLAAQEVQPAEGTQEPVETQPPDEKEPEPSGQHGSHGQGSPHGAGAQHGHDLGVHGGFARGGEGAGVGEAREPLDLTDAPRIRWAKAADGLWSDAANWSGGSVPADGEVAVFDREGEYTVTLDSEALVGGLELGGTGASPSLVMPESTLRIRGSSHVAPGAKIHLSGGIVTGPGDLEIRGDLLWTGGALSGSGTLRIAPDGRLRVEGPRRKVLSLRPLENAGTVSWEGSGEWVVTFSAPVRNLLGGEFVLAADALLDLYGSAGPTFDNAGLVRKEGPGTVTCEPPFTNTGQVRVEGGTLELQDGYVQTGGSTTVAAGAVMSSPAGFDIQGGRVTGEGQFPRLADKAPPAP